MTDARKLVKLQTTDAFAVLLLDMRVCVQLDQLCARVFFTLLGASCHAPHSHRSCKLSAYIINISSAQPQQPYSAAAVVGGCEGGYLKNCFTDVHGGWVGGCSIPTLGQPQQQQLTLPAPLA